MAGYKAFRESFLNVSPLNENDFSDFDARKQRYDILWAMYENSAYRGLHKWSDGFKATYGLYRYIRAIYNPAYRLGEFWQSHLWGGTLDIEAGDGTTKPTALPIVTQNNALRPAIAQVWRWSNWQRMKDILTLQGTVLGDACIKVVDDTERGKVYLDPIHPGTIKEVTLDRWGNVKGYIIEEQRTIQRGQTVVYREMATRNGENVVYQTYKDNALFAWDGDAAEWEVPYGFIPMLLIQHKNVGLSWGWSEMHAGLPSFLEVDDLTSNLNDQIRKMVNSPWFIAGMRKEEAKKDPARTTDPNNPYAAREEFPALFGPAGSSATAMVAPLSIGDTTSQIKEMLAKIEKDYPELQDNLQNAAGEISGRALRINRQPVEDKVNLRRPNYDEAMIRANQMAVAIGGYRGYFPGFDLDSYHAGTLDHTIGERPVFKKDPMDDIEVEQAFWTAAQAAKTAGIPLSMFLKRNGWSDEQIQEYENSPENKARLAALQASQEANNLRPAAFPNRNQQDESKQ